MSEIQKHIFQKTILKQYDIRGIVGKEINNIDAYYIGKSYGTLLRSLNKTSCVIGFDARATSKEYTEEAIKGLTECGIDVVILGLVPTPFVYFAIQYLKKDAGFIITASHNPPEYNGFKMLTNTDPIWGEDIQKLGKIAEEGNFFKSNIKGKIKHRNILESYYIFLLSWLYIDLIYDLPEQFNIQSNNKKLKICWDPGNGAVAAILKDFVNEYLPNENIVICDTVDATFPNHHPDPEKPENMKMLSEAVVKHGCDFGVAFDGDGDRVGIVDNEGYVLFGDQLLAIIAREFLKEHPGEKVMSEVSASLVLYNDITAHGGIPVMWKPGHSIQKAKMKSDNIQLAGETSGHIFFGENYNYDDAMVVAMKMMNIVSRLDGTLADLRKEFPVTYSTKKISIKSNDKDKFIVPENIANRLESQGREVCRVDGARVNKGDGWWLCRNSSTGPQMTVRCEALTPEGLEECKKELKEQLQLEGYTVEY